MPHVLSRHRNQLALSLITVALFAAPLVARAQEAAETDAPSASEDVSAPAPAFAPLPSTVQIETLPGTLLLGSTRASTERGDRTDKYRLFTLKQGQLAQLHVPDEALGSTSAALAPDGKRLLLNAGAPLAFGQTDAYVSVAWSQDGSQAIVVRPYPKGMALVSLNDQKSTPLPIVAQLPNFSPDGKQVALAFTAPGKGMASIYTAPVGQLDAVSKVSASSDYETDPQWLPDGSGIVYVAAGDQWQIRKVAAGDTSTVVLAQAPAGFVISDLAVAPGSAWIAYTLQSTSDG
ncbi:MAG: hypothetical protein E6I52_29680, partial [Chloroflexi bacterium]